MKKILFAISAVILQIQSVSTENETIFHKKLLKKFYQQNPYEGVLILNENGKHDYCHNMLTWLNYEGTPVTIITGNKTLEYYKYFNNGILAIVCMASYDKSIMKQLDEILNYIHSVRIIVIVDQDSDNIYLKDVEEFFHYCKQLKMLNVLVIFKDFYTTHKYLQYTRFPEFRIEDGVYDANDNATFCILPERLRDLKGYKLRTIADHIEPRSIEYYNERNESVLVGYVGRFVSAIARALNATLVFPKKIPYNVMVSYRDVIVYIDEFELDIPASSLAMFESDDYHDFSEPFEFGRWCFLLPMEHPIELKEVFLLLLYSQIALIAFVLMIVFTIVFSLIAYNQQSEHRLVNWPEILVNDVAIRGVLGQCFVFCLNPSLSLKKAYIMLLLTGVIISTLFNTYLLTFTTQPPMPEKIKTFAQLTKSHLRVAISQIEFEYLDKLTNGSLAYSYSKFNVIPDLTDFSILRDSFDRRYVFPATTSKMFYYTSLASFYNQEIFRISPDMCPNTIMQFVIPLGKNSNFRGILHDLILYAEQSGLLDYWMKENSFRDVQAAGTVININITHRREKAPLQVNDLFWIWIYYLFSITIAIGVFVLELISKKFNCQQASNAIKKIKN